MERFTSVPGATLVDTMAPEREIVKADGAFPFSAAQLVAASSFRKLERASEQIARLDAVHAPRTCPLRD